MPIGWSSSGCLSTGPTSSVWSTWQTRNLAWGKGNSKKSGPLFVLGFEIRVWPKKKKKNDGGRGTKPINTRRWVDVFENTHTLLLFMNTCSHEHVFFPSFPWTDKQKHWRLKIGNWKFVRFFKKIQLFKVNFFYFPHWNFSRQLNSPRRCRRAHVPWHAWCGPGQECAFLCSLHPEISEISCAPFKAGRKFEFHTEFRPFF